MSRYIAKKITINEKKNSIKVTVACNNVYPKDYFTSEYGAGLLFRDKLACLLQDILNGNIHVSLASNEVLFALMNNRKNEDLKKIKEFNDDEIWQFNTPCDKEIKRTKQEYANLEEKLRKMLLAYYDKYIGETKGQRYTLNYYGSYIIRVNPHSISHRHSKAKAKTFSKLACEALQSIYDHIPLNMEVA